MPGNTYRVRDYSELLRAVTKVVRNPLAVIAFGRWVYRGEGRDQDVIVVVNQLSMKEKFSLEYRVRVEGLKAGMNLDPHIMSLEDFKENLRPGTFLSGLALGYEVIIDRCDVEGLIHSFLEELSGVEYTLVNRYGEWDLRRIASITLRRVKAKRSG